MVYSFPVCQLSDIFIFGVDTKIVADAVRFDVRAAMLRTALEEGKQNR
jgi:hypothetical protein